MRDDMFKVIVERPRRKSRDPRGRDGRHYRDASDAAFLPAKAGYRDFKSLNENLRPLARFLEAQVGRPWNKVYGEIRAAIDGRNAVQHHVLQHLDLYVATRTRLVDERVIDLCGRWGLGVDRVWQPLFVHPRTGLLLKNPADAAARRHQRERAIAAERERAGRWREVSATEQLHRLAGSWFIVQIAPLPPDRCEGRTAADGTRDVRIPELRWDVVRKCHVCRADSQGSRRARDSESETLYGRRDVYAVAKRQLGGRELKRFGLTH